MTKLTNKPLIREILTISGLLFFIFVIGGSFLVKIYTGTFIFDWQTIKVILSNNIGVLLFSFAVMVFIMAGIVKYFFWMIGLRRNCQIQYVELEQIAANWLAFNDVEENIRERVETEKTQSEKTISSSHSASIGMKMLELTKEESRVFAKDHLAPFMDRFSEQEQTVAFDLLTFLDKEGGVPSVSSYFNNDPEALAYGAKEIMLGGKATFDILGTFTLLDHTIRVAKNIITILENEGDSSLRLLYARCVIAALAHDIGKVEAKQLSQKIRGELYRTNPHEQMSVVMLQEMFSEYDHLSELQSVVRSHHVGKTDSEIARYLKTADAKSREQEISLWMLKNKNSTKLTPQTNNKIEETQEKDVEIIEQKIKSDDINIVAVSPQSASNDYFADMMEPPTDQAEYLQQNPPKKDEDNSTVLTRDNKQNVASAPVTGYAFDLMQTSQYDLSAKLALSVNVAEKDKILKELKIESVSFGDLVLFDVMFFKKTVEKIITKRVDYQFIRGLVAQLSDMGVVKMIDVEKGFYSSKFFIEESIDGRKVEKNFIPVTCEFLGIDQKRAEELKRNSPFLRNVVIYTHDKSKES